MEAMDGLLYRRMINAGAANLRAHAREINELNVFPIPDGDTGDNMLMTMMGGVRREDGEAEALCEAAERVSDGMLLSARGNSGVILSQFFEGLKKGFSGLRTADAHAMGEAFRQGVEQAYHAVLTPTEGTILTVVREATDYACRSNAATPEEFLSAFIDEARRSLERGPELLPVLKKAGVVDSGAAGLIYIADGMLRAAEGEISDAPMLSGSGSAEEIDPDAFGEDSVLEFGYCTELLVRLQTVKTDIAAFDVRALTDPLQEIGDSIVAVQNGSIVKIHVHTCTPDRVLALCQRYGEFLKVKIENMSLQHNDTVAEAKQTPRRERSRYGAIAVATGEGLKQALLEQGADVIVDGGQSMNPSTEDFIAALDEVNADTVFVFPNNGNIILTAEQAASLYSGSDVRVIASTTVGAGYAALSMLDTTSGDTDAIVADLTAAMENVVTAEISHCVRDASLDGMEMRVGDYIGFVGKELLAVGADRQEVVCETVEKMGISRFDICILILGRGTPEQEAERIEAQIRALHGGKEIYIMNGGQDVYDYIIILE